MPKKSKSKEKEQPETTPHFDLERKDFKIKVSNSRYIIMYQGMYILSSVSIRGGYYRSILFDAATDHVSLIINGTDSQAYNRCLNIHRWRFLKNGK